MFYLPKEVPLRSSFRIKTNDLAAESGGSVTMRGAGGRWVYSENGASKADSKSVGRYPLETSEISAHFGRRA